MKCVCKDPKKRRKIGHGQGPRPLLNQNNQEYVTNVLAQHNKNNKGCDMSEAVDLVMEITDARTKNRACKYFKMLILPNFSNVVKKKYL